MKEYYLVETSRAMHQLSERLLQVEPGKEKLHIPNTVYFRFFMPVSLRVSAWGGICKLLKYHKVSMLKPQDSFGRFVLKFFSIFRKWTIPSESTIKPTGNCFE